MRHLAAAASHAGMAHSLMSTHALMVHAHLLLASVQGFLLLGSDQAVDLLLGRLVNLLYLFLLLLRRQRRVLTHRCDLRAGLALNGMHLLHHGAVDAGLLQARWSTSTASAHGRATRGWRGCGLGEQQSGSQQQARGHETKRSVTSVIVHKVRLGG